MAVQLSHVITIKRTKPMRGADGVMRNHVVTVSSEAEPDPKFRSIWVAESEAEGLFALLPKLDEPLPKKGRVEVVKSADDGEVF